MSDAHHAKTRFSVQLGDEKAVVFQEVIGLQTESTAIENRHGDRPHFSPRKVADLSRGGTVTMKTGRLARNSKFFAWCRDAKATAGRAVVIKLLDENGLPTMTWTLHNARPIKFTGPDLNAEGNDVTVESIEIAFDGLEVSVSQ